MITITVPDNIEKAILYALDNYYRVPKGTELPSPEEVALIALTNGSSSMLSEYENARNADLSTLLISKKNELPIDVKALVEEVLEVKVAKLVDDTKSIDESDVKK